MHLHLKTILTRLIWKKIFSCYKFLFLFTPGNKIQPRKMPGLTGDLNVSLCCVYCQQSASNSQSQTQENKVIHIKKPMWTLLWSCCMLQPQNKELKEMHPFHRMAGETKQLNTGSESVYCSKGWSIYLNTWLNLVLVVPRTEWWSRRSVLVLSTSGWSSPHRRCPEWTPEEQPQALWESITGTSLKTGDTVRIFKVEISFQNPFHGHTFCACFAS